MVKNKTLTMVDENNFWNKEFFFDRIETNPILTEDELHLFLEDSEEYRLHEIDKGWFDVIEFVEFDGRVFGVKGKRHIVYYDSNFTDYRLYEFKKKIIMTEILVEK